MKITKIVVLAGCLFLVAAACAQTAANWPCSDELVKTEGDNRRVRVSMSVTQALVQKKILPDVADLRHTKTNSTVILKALIGKDGVVRCADPTQGEATLFPRSVEAAKQWQFQPYLLNGEPIIVETTIEFSFKKGKVTAQ